MVFGRFARRPKGSRGFFYCRLQVWVKWMSVILRAGCCHTFIKLTWWKQLKHLMREKPYDVVLCDTSSWAEAGLSGIATESVDAGKGLSSYRGQTNKSEETCLKCAGLGSFIPHLKQERRPHAEHVTSLELCFLSKGLLHILQTWAVCIQISKIRRVMRFWHRTLKLMTSFC